MGRFYLQHGKPGEPMLTEFVDHKEALLWRHEKGVPYTSTGYGAKIPTPYMVKYLGKWRRVYCAIFSNSGTCYIGKNLSTGIRVDREF
jgi:hypothetical protein